jgi:hypothetical protein
MPVITSFKYRNGGNTYDNRVTLAGEHIHLLDSAGHSGLSVCLNDSYEESLELCEDFERQILTHVVLVDGDSEDVASRLIDDAEAVALALDNVDDRPRDQGAAIEAASTIDKSGVRDRDNAGGNIVVEERKRGLLPPVRKLDDLTVVVLRLVQLGEISNSRSVQC